MALLYFLKGGKTVKIVTILYRGGHPNRYTFKIGGHTELTQDQKTPIAAIKVGTQTNIFNFFGAVH